MKIIVGLGNSGEQYDGTRHNAGFYFVTKLAKHPELAPATGPCLFELKKDFRAEIIKTSADGEDVLLVKPQTFMNLSGEAVRKIINFYKIAPADIIVVSDDVDLPLGYARVRHGGGSGGHKGLQNIIDLLGTDEFTRIRLGISELRGNVAKDQSPDTQIDTASFVLQPFSDRETPILARITDEVIEYIVPFLGQKESEIPAHTVQVV
ncbi:MAG: aminoacyl-tRNA hydrolase [Patescibacteria group bacterium]